ncbi:flagellar protein FlgN [Paenibacillus sp. GCM10023250]|uniref:flagellar protein FlgN n=1 Tax=Paenibacillus sp. GCM10023250 TaxID=3252648 RepID=UPI00361BEC35
METAIIIELLDRLIVAHERLLVVSKEKTQSIIRNDLNALNAVIRSEMKLVNEIRELESQRTTESSRMMSAISGRAFFRKVTLKQLIAVVFDAEHRIALQNQHVRLSELLQELKQVTAHNQELIRQSLDFIRFSIDIFVSPVDESLTYSHPQHAPWNASRFGVYNSQR